MTTKNWHRAVHDAERERDNALAQLAHEQANRRQWQTQYQAEHRDYLNEVESDRDRLRDGIKALLPRLRSLRDTVEHLETYDGEDTAEDINTFCTFFAVLLEGQDVAKMFSDMDALLDGEAKG